MSRKHSINKEFRIDSLLNIVTNRNGIETDKTSCPNNYLTIMFLGINDKSISQEQSAKVSIIVSKIAQMKRKDCFTKNCDEVIYTKNLFPFLSNRRINDLRFNKSYLLFFFFFHLDGNS